MTCEVKITVISLQNKKINIVVFQFDESSTFTSEAITFLQFSLDEVLLKISQVLTVKCYG